MTEPITPAEALQESITDQIEECECSLIEVIGVLEVIKAELTFAALTADEDEAEEVEGEFESDGVVGE